MSFVRDNNETVSWSEVIDRIQNEFSSADRSVRFLEGHNSIEYAVKLLAAGAGVYAAVPLNTRWTKKERDNFMSRFESQPLAPGIHVSTSGSEGDPKLVYLTSISLSSHAKAVCAHLKLTSDDVWLACLPFFHVGGLTILFRCREVSASVRILDASDADEINRIIETERITLVSLVSTTLKRLFDLRNDKPLPKSLRAIIVGGGPVPEDLIVRCPIALPTYGLTEAGSMLTCARPNCSEQDRRSAGVPLPGVSLKIVDENGNECVSGETGIIYARSPGIFAGYGKDETKTAAAIKDGWLVTEDCGYLDENGCLHIESRREDLIVSGGENIRPREIEDVIRSHPDVSDCIVLPITHKEWGQVPGAFIVLNKKSRLSHEDLLQYLRERLSKFKLPKRVVIAEEIPLLPTGKVDRVKIKSKIKNQKSKN